MKHLEAIKSGKGLKKIELAKQAARTADGQMHDLYTIFYYSKMGNVANYENIDTDEQVRAILAYNAALPGFKQAKISVR